MDFIDVKGCLYKECCGNCTHSKQRTGTNYLGQEYGPKSLVCHSSKRRNKAYPIIFRVASDHPCECFVFEAKRPYNFDDGRSKIKCEDINIKLHLVV